MTFLRGGGLYTSENINAFHRHDSFDVSELKVTYVDNDEYQDITASKMFVNRTQTLMNAGKIIYQNVYHVAKDGTLHTSPNMITCLSELFQPTQETAVTINENEHKFIALQTDYNKVGARNTGDGCFMNGVKMLVRYE